MVPVPPLEIPRVPEMVESERQLAPMAKQPEVILNPTSEVEVALPEMFNPESVVVPKPVAETERNLVA